VRPTVRRLDVDDRPSSTFSPRATMHTASHRRSALSIMCVLKITVCPRAQLDDGVLERLRVDRIEAAERLVEDDLGSWTRAR
jgi:hypothetical protein